MAAKKKGGLGKGIEAYFPASAKTEENTGSVTKTASADKTAQTGIAKKTSEKKAVSELAENEIAVTVKLSKVEPNRNQPRKEFDRQALEELAESIRQYGLLQPVLVQDCEDHYEIIAGERRWRAARIAGLKEIPVIIRKYSQQEIVEISLIENIQREDLNPIEEAGAYKRLVEEFNLTQEEIAQRVSRSRTAVTNSLRLLKLTDEVQRMVIDERLTTGHARTLITVEDPKLQLELAQKIVNENLSVREAEKLVKNAGRKKPEKKTLERSLELIYRELESKMRQSAGTKVSIKSTDGTHGKVEIEFYSNDDLERITDLILSAGK